MSGLDHPLGYKKYFPNHTDRIGMEQEIEMYDTIAAEIFGIQGVPIDYYPADVNTESDPIFGEDANKKYARKHQLTAILKDGVVEETLLFNGFGLTNVVEFGMYIHINTFKGLFGQDRDPKPSDQFTFPTNTNLRFQVAHVGFTTLGLEGNVFGHRTSYELVCKEAEISAADEGLGEQYGVIQPYVVKQDKVGCTIQVVDGNYQLEDLSVQQCNVGETVWVLVDEVPCDAILPDGRIADKYKVPKADLDSHKGDNEGIQEAADGQDNPDYNVDNRGQIIVPRDRDYWGDW